jgi:phosphohistidine phosphatase
MDLILWRHAEAEDIHDGIDDGERKLTAKGKKQAQKMAAWLNAQLPDDVRIIVSPAVRAVQTAEALDRKFELDKGLFTSASISDLLTVSRWPVEGTVLLVGHQPTLGQFAALLMSGHPQNWDVKKGAVWWLRSAPEGSNLNATLRAAMAPAMLE